MDFQNRKVFFVGNSEISIGRYTYGQNNISVRQWGEGAKLEIGSFCSIASNVTVFLGGNHRVDWITTFPFGHIFKDDLGDRCVDGHPATRGDVVIGNDVWIGHGATIMSGVTIGDGAVIAANAHVVKNVYPYQIVGGNPCFVIKQRFSEEIIELLLTLKWWNLPREKIREISHKLCERPNKKIVEELILKYRNYL